MKRRFEETLLAVAIAALGVAATAMAPTIKNIKSVVIGNEGVSEANSFVYPDALNVDELASDPDGTVANDAIIWSYTGATDRYLINGVEQMNLGDGDDPLAPGAKQLDTQDLDTTAQVDNDPNTLTFRDATIDPIGGPLNTAGLPNGIVNPDGDMVTLFASDGTTYSMKSFYVYTDNGGEDRLSGSSAERIFEIDFGVTNPTTEGWTTVIKENTNPTFSTSGGMCINAGTPAQNAWGEWISPMGIFSLASNSVYRMRMVVQGEGQAVGTTPLWTVVVGNFASDGAGGFIGDNKWGAEWFFLDNENGANAPQANARSEFFMYWNPLPINDTMWNDETTGMFTPARVNGNNNDANITWRIIDWDGPVPGGNMDGGQLCLTEFSIDRIDYSDLASGTEVYNQTMTQANFSYTPFDPNNPGTSTVNWSGGAVTLTPGDGDWGGNATDVELAIIDMGDSNFNASDPATVGDNFPLTWNSDELLKTTVIATAPNATAEANPVDVVRLQADGPTTELLMYNLVVSTSSTLGLPRQNNDMEYVSFFYTHSKSQSSSTHLHKLRSRIAIICHPTVRSGNSDSNQGGITFKSMKVEVVEDPTM